MTRKIIWRVSPAPTGAHRSFQRRGWPIATFGDADGPLAANLSCEDEYRPSAVRSGKHGPITVRVFRQTPEGYMKTGVLKKKAAAMEEAKNLVADFYKNNPSWAWSSSQ